MSGVRVAAAQGADVLVDDVQVGLGSCYDASVPRPRRPGSPAAATMEP